MVVILRKQELRKKNMIFAAREKILLTSQSLKTRAKFSVPMYSGSSSVGNQIVILLKISELL